MEVQPRPLVREGHAMKAVRTGETVTTTQARPARDQRWLDQICLR